MDSISNLGFTNIKDSEQNLNFNQFGSDFGPNMIISKSGKKTHEKPNIVLKKNTHKNSFHFMDASVNITDRIRNTIK